MPNKALILGPTGRFGSALKEAFDAAGWRTKAFSRSRDNLMLDAKNHDVIVYGWNPAYQNWGSQARKCLAAAIEAAERHGCTLLFPGNVYVYGADAPEVLTEETPHAATNPLGRIRIEMEQMLERSTAQVILLRAGDFILGKGHEGIGPGNWYENIITSKVRRGIIQYPGGPDVPHSFTYLPDLARAFVLLSEKRANLGKFTALNFEGFTLTGQQIADHLDVRFGKFNWFWVWLLSFYFLLMKGVQEMRYLWDKPHRMDGSRFSEVLPDFMPTPTRAALRKSASLDVNPDETVIAARATV